MRKKELFTLLTGSENILKYTKSCQYLFDYFIDQLNSYEFLFKNYCEFLKPH